MGGSCNEESSSPLRIVLGALSASSPPTKSNNNNDFGPSPPAAAAPSQSPSPPPAAFILGTSYFATPHLGASPGSGGASRRSAMGLNKDGRVPMSDRKFYLDTFKPNALFLSTVRVTAINISTTLSTFFSDQLHSEQNVESMIDAGEITPREADEMNKEWENREWQLRKDALPEKIGWALLRFHVTTALMRFYELVMARHVLRVDGDGRGFPSDDNGADAAAAAMRSRGGSGDPPALTRDQVVDVMDRLTRDPFQASLRTAQVLRNQEHSSGLVVSSEGTETPTRRGLARRMFSTCLWANVIPFLAELTVQQLVLIYGYGAYYAAKRRRRSKRGRSKDGEEDAPVSSRRKQGGGVGGQTQLEQDEAATKSAYALALMFRSSRLTIARSMSWIAASAGGAMGSVAYPGWGTVLGIQIGDTLVGALTD